MNEITLETTLKSACDRIQLACEERGWRVGFVTAGIVTYKRGAPFSITINFAGLTPKGLYDAFYGVTFAEAFRNAMAAIEAAGKTEDQLAEVLGIAP